MTRLRHIHHDERGMSLVFMCLGLLSFMAATTLAIDVGMTMTARSQAQNSADAGALAGAIALVKDSYEDRSAGGPAVQSAIRTAQQNAVIGEQVSVTPEDVTFPTADDGGGNPLEWGGGGGGGGLSNRVQVQVHRTGERGNPVNTMVARFFGVTNVDITATATAEASPANAMTCVKPFMIPDKWIEKQTGPWDPEDTFDKYANQNKGVLLATPDVYIGGGTDYTGYSYKNDVGRLLKLRAGTGQQINPAFYFSWKMPGDIGGDFYRENIANCNTSTIVRGAHIIQEPGDKSGPTIQGIEELIAKDPGAYWDTDCNCVQGSIYRGQSPRVFPIPLYDPDKYADDQANGRVADFVISNFLGFFADHVEGNAIHGRVTAISGRVDPNGAAAPDNSLPYAIRLVK